MYMVFLHLFEGQLSEDCKGFNRFSVKQVYRSCVYALPDADQCHTLTSQNAEGIP